VAARGRRGSFGRGVEWKVPGTGRRRCAGIAPWRLLRGSLLSSRGGRRIVVLTRMAIISPVLFRSAKIKVAILFMIAVFKRIIISGLNFFLVLLLREKVEVDFLVLGMQRFRLVATLRIN
jgi:hypothetical protein